MSEEFDKKAMKEAKKMKKNKDGRQIHNPEIEEISKISEENGNVEEKKKIKLSKKTIKVIAITLLVLFVALVIIGMIETNRKERAKDFSNSLYSFIYGKYVQANIDLKDTKIKGKEEEAFKKIIELGKDIPEKAEYFMDEDLIKEYISVIEKMKKVVKDNGGSIKIEIYRDRKYKEIQITEVAFDDAIRFANEKIEDIKNKDKNFILGKKNTILVKELDSKTIGFFIRHDNIDGIGSSFYDE